MTQLTIEERLAIYQAIQFAHTAASSALYIMALDKIPTNDAAKAQIEQAKREAFYAAAFAWDAFYNDIDRERSAIDAGLAQAAAFAAGRAALDDLDPQLIATEIKSFDMLCAIDKDYREDHESIYQRYIEAYAYEGDVFIEDEVEAGVLLPDENGLNALYADFLKECDYVLTLPNYEFQLEAADIQVRLTGPHAAERAAFALATAAAGNKGAPGVCRYCNNTFKGWASESVNKGVCHVCDKIYTVAALENAGIVVLAYNPLTGELITDQTSQDDESDDDSPSLN